MDLERAKVEEIAGEIEAGLTCYVNRKTEEILSVYENDDDFFIEEGADEDKLAEILKSPDEYIRVEGMTSQEEFFLMQSFTEKISDKEINTQLNEALANRKPFAKFKDFVDESAELKKEWTDYKLTAFVDLVNQQLLELD